MSHREICSRPAEQLLKLGQEESGAKAWMYPNSVSEWRRNQNVYNMVVSAGVHVLLLQLLISWFLVKQTATYQAWWEANQLDEAKSWSCNIWFGTRCSDCFSLGLNCQSLPSLDHAETDYSKFSFLAFLMTPYWRNWSLNTLTAHGCSTRGGRTYCLMLVTYFNILITSSTLEVRTCKCLYGKT